MDMASFPFLVSMFGSFFILLFKKKATKRNRGKIHLAEVFKVSACCLVSFTHLCQLWPIILSFQPMIFNSNASEVLSLDVSPLWNDGTALHRVAASRVDSQVLDGIIINNHDKCFVNCFAYILHNFQVMYRKGVSYMMGSIYEYGFIDYGFIVPNWFTSKHTNCYLRLKV